MFYTNAKIPLSKTFFLDYFTKAFSDFRHKSMLSLALLPFMCAILLWFCMLFFGIIHFDFFIQQFPNIWINYASQSGFLPQLSFYLLIFFATLSMLLYGVVLVGIFMVILNALFVPFIVGFVHKHYYSHLNLSPPTFIESLKLSGMLFIKTFAKFAIFSLCCYLLGFIGLGFIGAIIGIFVYFQFYCKNLNHEIGISIMPYDVYTLFLQYNKIPLFFINVFIFMPLYIPIINCLAIAWQILVLTHYMFAWYEQYSEYQDKEFIEDAVIIE